MAKSLTKRLQFVVFQCYTLIVLINHPNESFHHLIETDRPIRLKLEIRSDNPYINFNYLEELYFTKPWWLAGGVSLDWIDEILSKIKPNGLDISSSIEISPGLKDIKKAEELFKFLKRD